MNKFTIGLGDEEFEAEGGKYLLGVIRIGEFSESFSCSLSYWERSSYLSQWREGLRRLLDGKGSSAIVTSMYNPESANFIFWWVMYAKGQSVYIQNHVLFLDELKVFFDEADVYRFVPDREVVADDGELISEWVIDVNDIRECLRYIGDR